MFHGWFLGFDITSRGSLFHLLDVQWSRWCLILCLLPVIKLSCHRKRQRRFIIDLRMTQRQISGALFEILRDFYYLRFDIAQTEFAVFLFHVSLLGFFNWRLDSFRHSFIFRRCLMLFPGLTGISTLFNLRNDDLSWVELHFLLVDELVNWDHYRNSLPQFLILSGWLLLF